MSHSALKIHVLVPQLPSVEDLTPYLHRIDAHRQYTNFGPLVSELEQRLVSHLISPGGTRDSDCKVATVSNATQGISLALAAQLPQRQGKVLVPALTFVGSVSAIVSAGFEPLYCDVDDQSWLLTPERAASIANARNDIVAVLPVCAFGAEMAIRDWDAFSARTGVKVVIDAAGAFGNQMADGSTPVVYSTHATKALGSGEGGFVASNDQVLIDRVRAMSNFGFGADRTAHWMGTNAKLSEYHAAVALAALDRWDDACQRRMALWHEWLEIFAPLIEDHSIHLQAGAMQRLHTILPVRFCRSHAHDVSDIANVLHETGVESRRWYFPLVSDHPGYSSFEVADDLTNSRKLSAELLGLPFHPFLSREDFQDVRKALERALRPTVPTLFV